MKNRYDDLFNTFTSLKNKRGKFRKQSIGTELEIYAGIYEGKYSLGISTNDKNINLKSTEILSLKWVKISNKDTLLFSLENEELLSIFIAFAIDLEEIIYNNKDIDIIVIYNRYLYWIKMFKISDTSTPENLIKGLISEIYFLYQHVIPNTNVTDAISAWIGPENAHKDIVLKNGQWFELKSINVGKSTVDISSIEQLSSEVDGYLVIIELEKTSVDNVNGIRLIDAFNNLKKLINIDDVYLRVIQKLTELNIDIVGLFNENHEINSHRYIIKNDSFFHVSNDFPIIKSDALPSAIGSVSYKLIISELGKHKVSTEEIKFE